MPIKDPKKNRIYQKDWAKRNRKLKKKYDQQLRIRALEKLGGKCVNCGCDDPLALEINHINGGNYKERKNGKSARTKSFYLDIIAERRTDVDLRCRVCNSLHYLVELKGLNNRWKIIWI